MPDLDTLRGYRRRIRIEPGVGRVRAALEDDYHCMAVLLHHDGVTVTQVEPEMERAPWTTCPGAVARLTATFSNVDLKDFAARGEKRTNCTHLHDLALLAAAHAHDGAATTYDILASDVIDDRRTAEIRRDGARLLGFTCSGVDIVEPPEIAGTRIDQLRSWIGSLDPDLREPARLLQWGALIAHGRAIPLAQQSDASRMGPNCFTFQPEQARHAVRVGKIIDFSAGGRAPLGAVLGA